jgi:hypothetical protein
MRPAFLFAIFLLTILSNPARGSVECPRPTVQVATDISATIRADISGLPDIPPKEFDLKAETVTRDLFHQYSNSGAVALSHSIISVFCQVLVASSLSDSQKLDQLFRLEESVTHTSGVSVPTSQAVATTCSMSSTEVLKPIRAVFDAWTNLNIRQYIAQWGEASIQRSSYYVRTRPEITQQRGQDFKKYSSVEVLSIEPKVLSADGTKARVTNVYSMRFTRLDGRVINENRVAESYILECSAKDNKWLIRENNDYLIH